MEVKLPNKVVVSIVIVAIVVSAWLLLLTFIGYGHLRISVPANAIVELNGHSVSGQNSEFRLRPGTYHISVTTPSSFSVYDPVTVGLFSTKTYTPQLKKRTPLSIVYATVGTSVLTGTLPTVQNAQWFGDDWIVAEVGPSTPDVLVAHYSNGRWNQAYLTGSNTNSAALPANIAQTVTSLEGNIHASLQ